MPDNPNMLDEQNMLNILHLSHDYAVILKPRGMLSEGEAEAALSSTLSSLGEENTSVYVVHRLDRTTAGVMVYARTRAFAAEISELIRCGGFHKTYTAFASWNDAVPPEGEMRDFLYFDRRGDKSYVANPSKKGAKEALLHYRADGELSYNGDRLMRVVVNPLTGRSHQIRVQLASRGCPLAGDGKYGSRVKFHGASLISNEIRWADKSYSIPPPALGEY